MEKAALPAVEISVPLSWKRGLPIMGCGTLNLQLVMPRMRPPSWVTRFPEQLNID